MEDYFRRVYWDMDLVLKDRGRKTNTSMTGYERIEHENITSLKNLMRENTIRLRWRNID